MTRPQDSRDSEGGRAQHIDHHHPDPLEIGQIERSLKLLRQIVVTAREIMDGGSPRSPSGAAFDIYPAARSVCLTLERLVEIEEKASGRGAMRENLNGDRLQLEEVDEE